MLTLERTRAVLERGVADGLHVGAQLCVRRAGEIVAELAFGLARPDTKMRHDTLAFWFSSAKPVMAVAIGQLFERGLLDFDDPAAEHLPEFAANGKAEITLRHLLTHSAGIPNAHRAWSEETWDEIVAKICAAAPEPGWQIGRDCGYHVASAWYVLGEIVRRVDGRSYDRYVREAIFGPLGITDFWIGMSAADYAVNRERVLHLYDASQGPAAPTSFGLWDGSQKALALCRPGGAGWGTARALSGLYAALLQGDSPVLRADTVRCLTAPALRGRDRVFQTVLERGLGVVLDSKAHGEDGAWYGRHVSPRAFGHGGFYSSVAFADPESDLAVAFAWNGIAPPARHHARLLAAFDALALDLA